MTEVVKDKTIKKQQIMLMGTILLIVVLTVVFFIRAYETKSVSSVEVKTINPSFETITEERLIPGEVNHAAMQEYIYQPELGDKYELLVEEGDAVEEKTPLIRYINNNLGFEQEQLNIQIEMAYLKINQIQRKEERLDNEEKRLKNDRSEEEAKREVKVERESLNYEQRIANLELRQLLLQKEQLESKIDNLTVRSKGHGEVLKVHNDVQLSDQPSILTVASIDQLEVTGMISERDSLVLKVGQGVKIYSETIINEEWEGVVESIDYYLSSRNDGDVSVQYPISVLLHKGDTSVLKPGYQMMLNIITDEREALVIPSSAIKQEENEFFVFVVEDNVSTKRKVELGIQSGTRFEVKSGLVETDDIVMESTDEFQDRMEVSFSD